MAKRKPQAIKAKEQTCHVEKKWEAAKQSCEAAKKAHEAHSKEIANIEEEMKKLEKERAEFEKTIETETLSQGISLELRNSQTKNYQRLKEQAAKRNAKCQEELDGLQREQKIDQDSLDNEMRKQNDAASKIKQKEAELEEQKIKLQKLIEYIK
jgi:structural maintenance of chromosome 1